MQNLFYNVHYVIILVTSLVSVLAFSNRNLLVKLLFHEGSILNSPGQWYRLLSSALTHGGLIHLIFNMVTLYFFSPVIISVFGPVYYLLIYVMSVLSGGLLSLFIHRKESNYTALGASGGVVGILFSSIALNPFSQIYIIPFPFGIYAWIFGVAYLAFTVYAMVSKTDRQIGHDAHFGGAIAGVLITILLAPHILFISGLYIILMLIPVAVGIYLIAKGLNRQDS